MDVKSGKEYDEKSMIIEQDRQARKLKRRKNRLKKRTAAGILFLLAAGGIWYFGWGRGILADAGTDTAMEIKAEEGQEIVYARLDRVNGNEISYTITEEAGIDSGSRPQNRKGDGGGQEQMPQNGSQGTVRENTGNERIGYYEGNTSGNDSTSNEGNTSGNDSTSNKVIISNKGNAGDDRTDSITALIPVGTAVTTKLGTVTTFSRLAAGDYVALIMETAGQETEIAAVYIMG